MIDIDSDTARRAANRTQIEDLSVNDTAYVSGGFCIKDGGVYIPGWVTPTDYSTATWTASGVLTQIQIVAGKRVTARFVDARQAQLKAQGNPNAAPVLSREEFNKGVIGVINEIFGGGLFFGTMTCDDVARFNPLRKLNLYAIDSFNGYKKLSQLLTSVQSKLPSPSTGKENQ
jgi:hypothetical protein